MPNPLPHSFSMRLLSFFNPRHSCSQCALLLKKPRSNSEGHVSEHLMRCYFRQIPFHLREPGSHGFLTLKVGKHPVGKFLCAYTCHVTTVTILPFLIVRYLVQVFVPSSVLIIFYDRTLFLRIFLALASLYLTQVKRPVERLCSNASAQHEWHRTLVVHAIFTLLYLLQNFQYCRKKLREQTHDSMRLNSYIADVCRLIYYISPFPLIVVS